MVTLDNACDVNRAKPMQSTLPAPSTSTPSTPSARYATPASYSSPSSLRQRHNPLQQPEPQQSPSSSLSPPPPLSPTPSQRARRAPSSLPPSPLPQRKELSSLAAASPDVSVSAMVKSLIPLTTSLLKANPWIAVAAPCLALIASKLVSSTSASLPSVIPPPPPPAPTPSPKATTRKPESKPKKRKGNSSLPTPPPPAPAPAPNGSISLTTFIGGGGSGGPGESSAHSLAPQQSPLIRLLLFLVGYKRKEWSFWWSLTWRLGALTVVVVALSAVVITVAVRQRIARRRQRKRLIDPGVNSHNADDDTWGSHVWQMIMGDHDSRLDVDLDGPGRILGQRAPSSLPPLLEDVSVSADRGGYGAGLLSLLRYLYKQRFRLMRSASSEVIETALGSEKKISRVRDSKLDPEVGVASPGRVVAEFYLKPSMPTSPANSPQKQNAATPLQPFTVPLRPAPEPQAFTPSLYKSPNADSPLSSSPARSTSSDDFALSTPPRGPPPNPSSPFSLFSSPQKLESTLLPAIPNVADISLSPLFPRSAPPTKVIQFDDQLKEIEREIRLQELRMQVEEDIDNIPLGRGERGSFGLGVGIVKRGPSDDIVGGSSPPNLPAFNAPGSLLENFQSSSTSGGIGKTSATRSSSPFHRQTDRTNTVRRSSPLSSRESSPVRFAEFTQKSASSEEHHLSSSLKNSSAPIRPHATLPTPPTSLFLHPNTKSYSYASMHLSTLPISAPHHPYLTRLHLPGNSLSSIPSSLLQALPMLKFLDLSDNRISEVPVDLGKRCPELREVYLRNNRLGWVATDAFLGLVRLEVLDMAKNGLSVFGEFALCPLPVPAFETNHSCIILAEPHFFSSLRRLHTLILSENGLRTLPASLGLLRCSPSTTTSVSSKLVASPLTEVGGSLTCLFLDGNTFDPSLQRLTTPLSNANRMMEGKVNAMLNLRKAIARDGDEDLEDGDEEDEEDYWDDAVGDGVAPAAEIGDLGGKRVQFGGVNVIEHNTGTPSPMATRATIVTSSNRPIKRTSLPEMRSPLDAKSLDPTSSALLSTSPMATLPRRNSDDSSSLTRVPQANNPAYVHLQRLLSHLHDLYDLDSRLRLPGQSGVVMVSGAVGVAAGGERSGDDPDAPGLTEKEREKILKRQSPVRRANVVSEVLATERTYVRELQALVDLYLAPLERAGDIVTAADVGLMFSNVRSILLFHQRHLLPELEEAIKNPDQPLGAVFLRCAPFFKMYSQYYNNFDVANQFITQLEQSASSSSSSSSSLIRPLSILPSSQPQQSSSSSTLLQNSSIGPNVSNAARKAVARRLKNFMKQAKSNPAHGQISLQAYLILPVQRLPRYRLLVDQLLESTPLKHADRRDMELAAVAVRDRVAECNDKKREMEETERGLWAMSRVKVRSGSINGDLFCHVRSGRRFLRQGSFKILKIVEAKDPALVSTKPSTAYRVDANFAVGPSKKDRFFQTALGPLVETRFVDAGWVPSSTPSMSATPAGSGPPVGVVDSSPGGLADAYSVYGLQRTTGKEFTLLLFSDVLCWCRKDPSDSGDDSDLIRAFAIGSPACSVERMVVLDLSTSATTTAPTAPTAAVPRGRFKQARTSMFQGSMAPLQRSGSVPPGRGGEPEAVLRVSDGGCVVYARGPLEEVEAWVEAIKGLAANASAGGSPDLLRSCLKKGDVDDVDAAVKHLCMKFGYPLQPALTHEQSIIFLDSMLASITRRYEAKAKGDEDPKRSQTGSRQNSTLKSTQRQGQPSPNILHRRVPGALYPSKPHQSSSSSSSSSASRPRSPKKKKSERKQGRFRLPLPSLIAKGAPSYQEKHISNQWRFISSCRIAPKLHTFFNFKAYIESFDIPHATFGNSYAIVPGTASVVFPILKEVLDAIKEGHGCYLYLFSESSRGIDVSQLSILVRVGNGEFIRCDKTRLAKVYVNTVAIDGDEDQTVPLGFTLYSPFPPDINYLQENLLRSPDLSTKKGNANKKNVERYGVVLSDGEQEEPRPPETPNLMEDIEVGDTILSFTCSLSLTRIEHPAKGRLCKHQQCFDAK
ncbi:hypothetical protein HDU67_001682, partial [Dinochytrium kinnereticum]